MTVDGNQLPFALRAAYLALHRKSDALFGSAGVTADQFVLLATLSEGQTLTQRELARRMPSDPSTVRAMLVLLERDGWVQRARCTTDARARTVALTPAGRRKFRRLWSASEPIRTQMLAGLESHEVPTLIDLLTRIAAALTSGVAAPDALHVPDEG